MQNLKKLFTKIFLSTLTLTLLTLTTARADDPQISIWWPTEGASVADIQPFKALIDGRPIDDYQMYWQVDSGQLNDMPTNTTDWPHKEASVDVSSWNWRDNGEYAINFIAKNNSGDVIAERSVKINVVNDFASGATNESASETIATTSETIVQYEPITTSQILTHNIWWPTDGATIDGKQPFKAQIAELSPSEYQMYWQVDNGAEQPMFDNYTDGPHDEAEADVSSWNWSSSGLYVINFIAKDSNDQVLSSKSVMVKKLATQTKTVEVINEPEPTEALIQLASPKKEQAITPLKKKNSTETSTEPVAEIINAPVTQVGGNPLSSFSFYVNPNSNARRQAMEWRASRPEDAAQMDKIANEPEAKWLGDWNRDIYTDTKNYVEAAAKVGKVPVLIAYNIPQRDCGNYSAGGAFSGLTYQTWINALASGLGSNRAVIILEPDALSLIECLNSESENLRYNLLSAAVSTIKKSNPNAVVYIDAGNSNWISPTNMSERLRNSGIAQADGFAVNVSNYYFTADAVNFGNQLSKLVNGKHFVVDTSRNGLGSNGNEWCNPSGRALGNRTTTNTGNSAVDAFLWLKNPGESDGTCNGGPSAGVWWPDYALGLAERAAY